MDLKLKNIQFGHKRNVLGEIEDVTLRTGELNFLIGSNGIGKSTLMRTIAGQLPMIGKGRVIIDDEDLSNMSLKKLAHRIAYVRRSEMNSRITVEEFLVIGLGSSVLNRLKRKHIRYRIRDYCSVQGLKGLMGKFIGQISDGEYQKVLIGLHVMRDCPVLLLDEPLNHLDPPSQLEIMTLFKKLSDKHIVLISTHNLERIVDIGGRVFALTQKRKFQEVDYHHDRFKNQLDGIYGERMNKSI